MRSYIRLVTAVLSLFAAGALVAPALSSAADSQRSAPAAQDAANSPALSSAADSQRSAPTAQDAANSPAPSASLQTVAEQSHFLRTGRYDEVARLCAAYERTWHDA